MDFCFYIVMRQSYYSPVSQFFIYSCSYSHRCVLPNGSQRPDRSQQSHSEVYSWACNVLGIPIWTGKGFEFSLFVLPLLHSSKSFSFLQIPQEDGSVHTKGISEIFSFKTFKNGTIFVVFPYCLLTRLLSVAVCVSQSALGGWMPSWLTNKFVGPVLADYMSKLEKVALEKYVTQNSLSILKIPKNPNWNNVHLTEKKQVKLRRYWRPFCRTFRERRKESDQGTRKR